MPGCMFSPCLDLMENNVNDGFCFKNLCKPWCSVIFGKPTDGPEQKIHQPGQYLIKNCLKFDFKKLKICGSGFIPEQCN